MSNAIILDNSTAQASSVPDKNNSRIAWDNALNRATVVSAIDNSNLPNIHDYTTTSFWSAGSGTVDIDITLGAAEDIDCCAIAAGNWAAAGTVIEVYSDAGVTKVGEISGLKDGQPHLFNFDSVFISVMRIRFISSNSLSVGQVLFGETLKFPTCANIGLQLGQFNNKDKVIGQKTENNAFGSNSIVARGRDTIAPYSLVPISWVRSDWIPFSDNHRGKPIWFSWNILDNPEDAIFGRWSTDSISFSKSTFSDIKLTVKGQI